MGKYSPKIDLNNKNSSQTKIIDLVGNNKKIIEFGCAAGHMSEILLKKYNCEIVGLESDEWEAQKARLFCKEVIVGDIESSPWPTQLSGTSFDVALFADVLEHLKDPQNVLNTVKDLLKEDGYILVSVPNIAHLSIRLELLAGSFEYENLGILDSTHLKHFTINSIIRLIEDAGYFIDLVDYVVKDLPDSIIRNTFKVLDLVPTPKTIDHLSTVDSLAFQWIVKALKRKPDHYTPYVFVETEKPERLAEKIYQEHISEIELAGKQLTQADNWLRQKDQQIQEQIFQLQEKDHQIQEHSTRLQEKDQQIQEQTFQLQEKDQQIQEQTFQLQEKDHQIQEYSTRLQEKDQQIQEQKNQLEKFPSEINRILSELNLIKHSRVWRIAELFRRVVYQEIMGKFPLLQKKVLAWSRRELEVLHPINENFETDSYRDKIPVPTLKYEPYETYVKNNLIQPHIEKILKKAASQFKYRPLISIIMPVYNVEPRWLIAALDSVCSQIYPFWELCIADDASTNQATIEVLKKYSNHEKIKIIIREQNGHICAASNSAADLAQGEFVAFMDNDDLLAPNALFEIVRLLQNNPDCDLIYSDEDKIDENDKRYDPQFKPDWSPELFLSYNYINHFTCVWRSLFESVGRFRIGFEGAQDYDLLLRIIGTTGKIKHIPKILYYWRAIKGSTALEAGDKPIMHVSARRGLKDHLERKGIEANIYQPGFAKLNNLPIYQLDWPDTGPSVTIIIPTYNQFELLQRCIETITKRTTYDNYDIMVIDNDSDDENTLKYLKKLKSNRRIKVESISNDNHSFSFSRINNLAVRKIKSDLVLFLNNDIEVMEPKWLSRLVGYLGLPGVGIAGAKLLYPNKTIQHAGVVLGMHDGIIPDHAFLNHPNDKISYYFLSEVARNCSAVTGACLLTRRSDFIQYGGFNEQDLKVSLQDVDYCLRLNKIGLRTVYVAGAELIHHQSVSRPHEDDPRELVYLRKTYEADKDPYYNINLSTQNSFAPDTSCTLTDYNEYIQSPLKIMIFTHNFELAGAPKAMLDLALGLQKKGAGKVMVEMVSPIPGPFQSVCEKMGIKNRIIDIRTEHIGAGWNSKTDYETGLQPVRELFQEEKPDVLISNTIFGFYVLRAAQQNHLPVIWVISESFDHDTLQHAFNDFTYPDCIAAFAQAYSVIFGSQGTRNHYEYLNSRNNFQVIHNSVEGLAIDQFIKDISKEKARSFLGVPAHKKMLLMVGTICERKGQVTLAEAIVHLKKTRNNFCCYLVGANEKLAGAYLEKIHTIINQNKLEDVLKVIPEVEELYWYYRAADVFVFTSQSECYPLAILEAMAFGLPIVTTPCCGVTEQVRSVNASFFEWGDSQTLATQLDQLLSNDKQIAWLGGNSKAISEYQQTYPEMIDKYMDLVYGAWVRGKDQPEKNDGGQPSARKALTVSTYTQRKILPIQC